MPQIIVEFAQILVPFFIKVFLNFEDQSPFARGNISLVVITLGPINTSSSIITPSYIKL
jgi:hypothetical protein